MNWYISIIKNGLNFSGRSRRKDYFLFTLINFLIFMGIGTLEQVAFGTEAIFAGIFMLAMLLPGLAVTVRRLHDTGRSGFWLLLSLIPLLGSLILLVFMFFDSQTGDNQYGSNPKASGTQLGLHV